jgi:hypothetical protein
VGRDVKPEPGESAKGRSMKVYRVILMDGAWCAFTSEQQQPVVCSDDKSVLVECACALGRKRNAEVHVYDELGRLESVHSFEASEFPNQ